MGKRTGWPELSGMDLVAAIGQLPSVFRTQWFCSLPAESESELCPCDSHRRWPALSASHWRAHMDIAQQGSCNGIRGILAPPGQTDTE